MLGAPSSFWAKLISHSVPNSRGDRGLSQAKSSRAYEHCGPTFETAAGALARCDGENKVETKEEEQVDKVIVNGAVINPTDASNKNYGLK